MRVISRYDEVVAALEDPAFAVPPAAPAATGVAWLRSHVARFSEGAEHEHRRALAVAELDKIDPEDLRVGTGTATAVLAAALGVREDVVPYVAAVASVYLTGVDVGPEADAAVERLVTMFGGVHDDETAARIGLLLQAHTATATLVRNALEHGRTVEETVRIDSPVPGTRRLDPDGDVVFLDFVRANAEGVGEPVTFGAGRHRCPGRAHALAMAQGQVERAEGRVTEAEGHVTRAEGRVTKAEGHATRAEGHVTRAEGHVERTAP